MFAFKPRVSSDWSSILLLCFFNIHINLIKHSYQVTTFTFNRSLSYMHMYNIYKKKSTIVISLHVLHLNFQFVPKVERIQLKSFSFAISKWYFHMRFSCDFEPFCMTTTTLQVAFCHIITIRSSKIHFTHFYSIELKFLSAYGSP